MPLLILLLCFTYAACRYVVFGDIAVDQLPAFIANKAFAFTIAALLLMAAIKARSESYGTNNDATNSSSVINSASVINYGRWAWQLLILHGLMSSVLFSAQHYPKFFDQGIANLTGQLVILAGVLAALGFYRLQKFQAQGLSNSESLKGLCALLLAAHVVAMSGSWLSPEKWPGYLPPVSLLSFLLATTAAILFFRRRD